MAHFAEIDENNIVIQVLVTDNNDPNGDEGYQLLVDMFGGRWIKTSYNTIQNSHILGGNPFRGNYGTVGMVYDEEKDIFLHPKPFPSYIFNESKATWDAPAPYPSDDKLYTWDEETLSWIEVTE